jgi:hypothetical protein
MDAHKRAREYLERHGIERWFRSAAEKLIVAQPEDPFSVLHEALGNEVAAREEQLKRQGEGADGNGNGVRGGASLVAQIAVRGRGGVQQVISLDKVANEDMARGARGAITLRGWGNELKSKVAEALLGHRGGGATSSQVSHAQAVEKVGGGGYFLGSLNSDHDAFAGVAESLMMPCVLHTAGHAHGASSSCTGRGSRR